jgi:uncharacterized protein
VTRGRWFLALALCAGAAAQPAIPANDGWVTDLAKVLKPEQEAELEQLMAAYQTSSRHDVALLTLPNLGGRSIEEVGLNTFRAWQLGQRELHDGALLVIAIADRRMRIEVGRGLEGTLTDAVCGRIIRGAIAPALRDGRTYDGLRAGLLAIHAAAGSGYADPQPVAEPIAGGSIVFFILLFIIVVMASRKRQRMGGSWIGPTYPGSWTGGHGGFSGGRGGGFGGFGGGGGASGGGASGSW